MKQLVAKKLINRVLSKAAVAAVILSMGMSPAIVSAAEAQEPSAEVKTDTTVQVLFQTEPMEAAVMLSERDFEYVYSSSNAMSDIIGKIYDGNLVTILESDQLWCHIQSGSVDGYVSATFLTSDSKIVDEAEAEGESNCGETLEEEKLRLEKEEEEAVPMGQQVIDYAMQFVGNPYVYGGSSLTKGTDCSGYVMSVYAHFDVSLPHSSYELRSEGKKVSLDKVKPGDIICYEGHVALYAGDGKIVHASNSRTGIVVGNMNYRTPICARRIF